MHAGHDEDKIVLTDHKAGLESARNALILYGSETGNAQEVAEEIGRLITKLRFNTVVIDLDSIQLRDVLKYTFVVFVVSTTGQGEFPQNARGFWKTLLSGALKARALRKLSFTSFGLGDSSYPRYNVAHRMLHGRLLQLGARAICERGEGNEQHPEGHAAGLREWLVQCKGSILAAYPLPAGQEVIADGAFIEPSWKLILAQQHDLKTETVDGGTLRSDISAHPATELDIHGSHDVEHRISSYASTEHSIDNARYETGASAKPSIQPLPVRAGYIATITASDRLTTSTHFQDVRLLDLTLKSEYDYGPGAVAVVYPKNFPQDVDQFIDLMLWHKIADLPLDLISTQETTTISPSPLRHLNTSGINMTLRWLLENVLDIMSIPRRSFFAQLAQFVKGETEDEAYQKERLLELANPELIDELWDYTTRPKRTILEVMMDFTRVKIPWQHVLSLLPVMRGRQFSIASGGLLRQTDGKTRVQLLVAIVDPPSPIIKWRRRYGVCTRYIASLESGQQISIGMQPGYLNVTPAELDVPVIMIGPGTGVAPMRAMIHQRLQWGKQCAQPLDRPLSRDMLFFGCRTAVDDHFFKDEWSAMAGEGLHVSTAFSRDAGRKEYVQDTIKAHADQVARAVIDEDAKIYVCGSSGNMPKGVREALLDVMQDRFQSRSEAEDFLDSIERDGRYKQETW